MRGGRFFALLIVAGGVAACLVTIDESKLDSKAARVEDEPDAKSTTKKRDAAVAEADASVDPIRAPDGGLSCPEPTTLCGDRCFDVTTSSISCGTCFHNCGEGTACLNSTCRASSCRGVRANDAVAPTGPTTIAFQGTELSVFCDQETRGGGWTMMHRLSAGNGIAGDPFALYTTIPLNDTVAAELTTKKTATHYTSRILGSWNSAFPVAEVMLRIYDEAGAPKKEIVFNGTGSTFLKFMTPDKLSASSWTDLNAAVEFSAFGIEGTADIQRRFLVHKKYTQCPEDTGWLIVHGSPPDVPCKAEYEAPFDHIRIVYAAGTTAQRWSEGFAEAASFAVFVR